MEPEQKNVIPSIRCEESSKLLKQVGQRIDPLKKQDHFQHEQRWRKELIREIKNELDQISSII
jgi:hypothetical protein